MPCFKENEFYSDRLSQAISYALYHHRFQARNQGCAYASHLLQVAGLILEMGGNEDEAIAGILHDILEDIDIDLASEIEEKFGAEVLRIVEGVSEDKSLPKAERKALYIEGIKIGDRSIKLISFADKYHNLHCYRREGVIDKIKPFFLALLPAFEGMPREYLEEYREMLGLAFVVA